MAQKTLSPMGGNPLTAKASWARPSEKNKSDAIIPAAAISIKDEGIIGSEDVPYMNLVSELEQSMREFEKMCNMRVHELRTQTSNWETTESRILNDIHAKAPEIKKKILELDTLIRNEDGVLTVTEVRMFQNTRNSKKKKFVECLRRINEEHEKSDTAAKKRIRQIRSVVQGTSAEDPSAPAMGRLQRMYDEDAEDVAFQEQILEQRHKDPAMLAYMYAQETLPEIKQMEKQIIELHQMFVEMSNLVDIQGEYFAPIEAQVQKAIAHTAQGMEILESAEKHVISVRKKKLLIIAIVIACIAVVALIICGLVALACAATGVFA